MTVMPARLQAVGPYRTIEPFVLASASPRRRELLIAAGLAFEIIPSDVDESVEGRKQPSDLVIGWAEEKAEAVAALCPGSWILAADTVVVLDGVVFGKPADASDAARMLKILSGRVHEVFTGVCLLHKENGVRRVQWASTRVGFKMLTDAEIRAYVATGDPLDKAGAYGIQGVGAFLIRSVEGSYTNVVGLPLAEALDLLMEYGVVGPRAA